MKFILGVVISLILMFSSQAWACGGGCGGSCSCSSSCGAKDSCSEKPLQSGKEQTTPQKVEEVKTVEINNKICPVDKTKIGSMGKPFKVEYEGKVYNLCCADCEKSFKNNAKKYIKIINKENK